MPSWVSDCLETVSSRTGPQMISGDMGRGISQRPTSPELFFVLEVISNLVFHAMNSFMSS